MNYTESELRAIQGILTATTTENAIFKVAIAALIEKTDGMINSFHTPDHPHVTLPPVTEEPL